MAASAVQCSVPFGCPLNHFCYKPTGLCEQCLDCSLFNRLPYVSQSCHESPRECGGCLPGFREEYLAENIKREACGVSESTTSTSTGTTEIETTSSPSISEELIITSAALSVASVIIFSIAGVCIFRNKRRKVAIAQAVGQDIEPPTTDREQSSSQLLYPQLDQRSKSTIDQVVGHDVEFPTSRTEKLSSPLLYPQLENLNDFPSILQEHLPPYKDDPGEIIRVPEEQAEELHILIYKEEQVLLTTIPYMDPVYLRVSGSESIEDEDHPPAVLDIPAVDDEDTNPSTWEPATDQQPRNTRETDDNTTATLASSEADSADLIPSSDAEQILQPCQSTAEDDLPSTQVPPSLNTDDINGLEVAGAIVTSSCSLQFDEVGSFKHSEKDCDLDEPVTKRSRKDDDAVSLGEAPQTSIPPLVEQNNYGSLFEDLTVVVQQPNRVPTAISDSNLRHV